MKKVIPLIIVLLILSACTPKEYKTHIAEGEKSFLQSKYEDALQFFELALDAKETDEVNKWITYTKDMLERKVALNDFDIKTLEKLHKKKLDFPDDWEGKIAAADQLEEWHAEVEDLFTEITALDDYFSELDETLKKEDFKQAEKQLTEIEVTVNAAKKQVYFDTYTSKLKDTTEQVTEKKTAYEKEQKRIAEEKKKEEEKRKKEEEKKKNMYNWSDAEITTFMQSKFSDIANENLLISIGDRSKSTFQVEVRFDSQPDNTGDDEPYLTHLQGLFEVHEDGSLYELHPLEGSIPVNY